MKPAQASQLPHKTQGAGANAWYPTFVYVRFSGDPGIAGSVEVKHCLCKLKPRSRLVQVRRRGFERGSLEGLK